MLTDHWPLFGLRLTTPRLELRVPDLDDMAQLAGMAAAGVHDPAVQSFLAAWTDGTPAQSARNTMQWMWGQWPPDEHRQQPAPVRWAGAGLLATFGNRSQPGAGIYCRTHPVGCLT